jgi:hypothetical protein
VATSESSRIPRKPVAPSHFDSSATLRESVEASDRLGELRNPLIKPTFQITPEQVQPSVGPLPARPYTGTTTVGGEATPPRIHTHITLPRSRRRRSSVSESHMELLRALLNHWGLELVCCWVSLLCFISELPIALARRERRERKREKTTHGSRGIGGMGQ